MNMREYRCPMFLWLRLFCVRLYLRDRRAMYSRKENVYDARMHQAYVDSMICVRINPHLSCIYRIRSILVSFGRAERTPMENTFFHSWTDQTDKFVYPGTREGKKGKREVSLSTHTVQPISTHLQSDLRNLRNNSILYDGSISVNSSSRCRKSEIRFPCSICNFFK